MKNKDPRLSDIKRMKKNRYTFQDIANKYGISRQRCWQILRDYKGKK